MGSDNAHVLLSGIGGDQLFWSQPSDPGISLGDLLMERRYRDFARESLAWARSMRLPLPSVWWTGVLRPRAPAWLQARTFRIKPMGDWFDTDFVRRMNLRERMLPIQTDYEFTRPSQSRHYGYIARSMRHFELEWTAPNGHVDVRYPYLDRRLVEFALAIPIDQTIRPGESRVVMRRAVRGHVPDMVIARRSKAGPSQALQRASTIQSAHIAELTRQPRVADYGYVPAEFLREAVRRDQHGLCLNRAQLTKTIALEMWLRTLEGDTPSVTELGQYPFRSLGRSMVTGKAVPRS